MELSLLQSIKSPQDLKGLNVLELDELAAQIRAFLVASISIKGGHLASSLGAVDLIIALHRVFNKKDDRLLFDVGHQAYAHKILTGRFDNFMTLREFGGISGFTNPRESEYDTHASGHASDSLSVAEGLRAAMDLSEASGKVAVLIGDAAISGGLAFEALNQIGQNQSDIKILLNDNDMSISKNVGALSLSLAKLRLSKGYMDRRDEIQNKMNRTNEITKRLMRVGSTMKTGVKSLVVPGMLFEEMGITYVGPIDGHNIAEVENALRLARKTDFPVLIHAVTSKGKGYSFAEKDPCKFHGIGAFDVENGELLKNGTELKTFTGEFSELLIKHAKSDERIVAVTAAMETGTGLQAFNETYPKRFFDVGIAEEHAVALAAGLAIGGKLPVVAIYSTFLQRAYDEIVTNVALPNLNVVFCIDRAGIVGADGATHHGLLDISYLRSIPNMKILAPSSTEELASAFEFALASGAGPIAIRYPKAQFSYARESNLDDSQSWASGNALKVGDSSSSASVLNVENSPLSQTSGAKITIFAVGKMLALAKAASAILREAEIDVDLYDARWLKPISEQSAKAALDTDVLITLEDGTTLGGFGSGLLEKMSELFADVRTSNKAFPKCKILGVPDTFVSHGSESDLFESLGLTPEGVAQTVKGLL